MKLNPFQLMWDADIVVKFVIFILLAASFVCWAIIIQKILRFQRILKENDGFMTFFDRHSNLQDIFSAAQRTEGNPLTNLFRESYAELEKIKDGSSAKQDVMSTIQRTILRTKQKELASLEQRIPFLATTGSAAPFIGLFGTVWGIMNAFLNIGVTGAANLATVAPGIAEALIATAIGLFAAIPAVIGYNFCVSKIRKVAQDLDVVAHYFMNMVHRTYL